MEEGWSVADLLDGRRGCTHPGRPPASRWHPAIQVLDQEEARIAGEAVWHFILETFGRQAALDVLSGFKAGRTLDAGFRRIGFDLEGVFAAAQAHHLIGLVAPETSGTTQPVCPSCRWKPGRRPNAPTTRRPFPHRSRRKYRHHRFAQSADGQWTAWATDERGQIRIWVSDGHRKRCLARYDHKLERIVDPTYPVP